MHASSEEGKRKRGQLNGTQRQIMSINASTILGIVRENDGLNISEISRLFPKKREEFLHSSDVTISPELQRKLPPVSKGDHRKTVRKHLNRMLVHGQVRLLAGRYYPREYSESKKLVELVNRTMSSVEPQNWSFPLAEDVAICRSYVAPARYRNRFDDFFAPQQWEFKNSLFFLGQLLEDALGKGHLSTEFYNPADNSLNLRLLRDGWKVHFENTTLLISTFAISPSKLLELIQTADGQRWTKELLAVNGVRILAKGRKRLAETRAMERKLKKIQALIAKRMTPSAADESGKEKSD
jgi:hypothetical protein